MKHVFIINPISGTGRYRGVADWVTNYFTGRDNEFEIRYTEFPGHAASIAAEYENNTVLYAVGGDGTAHEVLNGMNFDTNQLAIIPVGTGNDFWRMYAIDGSIETILEKTVLGEPMGVDVGKALGKYFLNCLNIGVDAEVNRRVNKARKTVFPRSLVYIYYALAELLKKKTVTLEFEIDGERQQFQTLLASFMNGKWYGGGFKSAPNALFNDGLMDVTIVEDLPLYRVPFVLPKYFKGTHLGLDVVNTYRAQRVRVISPEWVSVGFDGEVLEINDIELEMLHHKLQLRVPLGHGS